MSYVVAAFVAFLSNLPLAAAERTRTEALTDQVVPQLTVRVYNLAAVQPSISSGQKRKQGACCKVRI